MGVVLDAGQLGGGGRVGDRHGWIVDRVAAMARGRLITIEGIDGAGKTTLAADLSRGLLVRGVANHVLREPGGVELSERIRDLVKDPELAVRPRAEALLDAAARAQLVDEQVVPLLEQGQWVILDRFVDSSLAYQGAGRGLGVGEIRAINRFATRSLAPDRTLLLQIDLETARGRQDDRGEAPDRLEREKGDFFLAVWRAYDELARAEPRRIRAIDATQPPDRVLATALAGVEDLLPPA
jgi:dTMP kinase